MFSAIFSGVKRGVHAATSVNGELSRILAAVDVEGEEVGDDGPVAAPNGRQRLLLVGR
jgi:hypothetical protein